MGSALQALRQHLGEVTDLEKTKALLSWDSETKMPSRAAAVRAEQIGTIARFHHEHFSGDLTGRLLEAAEAEAASLPTDSDDACLVRYTRRQWEKKRRVPVELAAEIARAGARGFAVWVEARANNDFAMFKPILEEQLTLKLRYAERFPEAAEPYDACFDDLEHGTTAAEIRAIFDSVREGLVPLVRTISARQDRVNDSVIVSHYPKADQEALCVRILGPWGFEPTGWRFDETHHPFEVALATTDVRLTTRYDETRFDSAFYGALHECGHGLFEAGVDPALERTPLCHGCSLALHESQSRLWENLVGRSRAYWTFAGPIVREAFPGQLGHVDDESLYRAINKMEPSLIRVEADETTYSLHIILRFELELALLNGDLAVADLPEAWNAKMQEYLGLTVPSDTLGCMQDAHWSDGGIAGFPVYALGNIIASQIWGRVQADIPDLEAQFARGEFAPLRTWLTERLYRHGRKFTPTEQVRMVAGGPIDPQPYLAYLTQKVASLYGPIA